VTAGQVFHECYEAMKVHFMNIQAILFILAVFASTAKTCYGRDLGVHFYKMELSRTVLHRIPDGGYNELRRRSGTAPVTQISAPVANQRHGMGTPPKSPPGFMH